MAGRFVRCLMGAAVASATVLGAAQGASANPRERVLIDQRFGGCSDNCAEVLFSVDGARDVDDPRMYVITMSSSSTPTHTYGVFTNGLVGEPVHVQTPGSSPNSTRVVVKYRYQTDLGFCAFQADGACVAHVPSGPPTTSVEPGRLPRYNSDWELGDRSDELIDFGQPPAVRSSDSALILEIWTVSDGDESVRRLEIPFAGQPLSVIPG